MLCWLGPKTIESVSQTAWKVVKFVVSSISIDIKAYIKSISKRPLVDFHRIIKPTLHGSHSARAVCRTQLLQEEAHRFLLKKAVCKTWVWCRIPRPCSNVFRSSRPDLGSCQRTSVLMLSPVLHSFAHQKRAHGSIDFSWTHYDTLMQVVINLCRGTSPKLLTRALLLCTGCNQFWRAAFRSAQGCPRVHAVAAKKWFTAAFATYCHSTIEFKTPKTHQLTPRQA